jgi:hypothetical protein
MPAITITIEEPGEWRRPMRLAWKAGLDEIKRLAALSTQWAEAVRADPARQIEVIRDPLVTARPWRRSLRSRWSSRRPIVPA